MSGSYRSACAITRHRCPGNHHAEVVFFIKDVFDRVHISQNAVSFSSILATVPWIIIREYDYNSYKPFSILVIFCFSILRSFGAHVNKCFIIKDNIYRHVFFSGNSKPLFPIGYQNITSWHYKHVGTFLLASIRLSFRLSLINAHSCINRSEIHVFRCISGITRIHM